MSTKLHYRVEGEGSPVVLLHPVGLDLTCWDPVIDSLATRHRVIRMDLRGHGRSGTEIPGMLLKDYAEDVHETLAAAGQGPAAVVGLSFGGMVAQSLAIHWPADVTRLIVAGCPCTLPEPARHALSNRGLSAINGGMAAVIEETLQRWFTPEFLARQQPDVALIAQQLRLTSPSAWNQAWQAISQIETAPRLGDLTVPVLCIAGERDSAAAPAALSAIAERIPGGRLLVLAGAPHIMQVEQPGPFSAAVLAFLSGAEVGQPVQS